MGQMYSQDELAARDQALVAKCCRWVKEHRSDVGDGGPSDAEQADKLWHAMGYEGALNAFELEEKA